MRLNPRLAIMLFVLLIAAGALSLAVTDRASARDTLQESTIDQSPLPPPVEPTAIAPVTPVEPPIGATPFPSPTPFTPIPTIVLPTMPPTPTETPIGFLPPPALTLLETPVAAAPPTRISALETSLAARRAQQKTPDPALTDARPNVASMVDTGVTALNYLWLACGLVLLIGAGAALIWLMRRRPPGG